MSTILTVQYKCDDCGAMVSFAASTELYGDICLQLPPRWGQCAKGAPGPDDLLDLCPDCATRYQAAGLPVKGMNDSDFGFTHFKLTFGEEAYRHALVP